METIIDGFEREKVSQASPEINLKNFIPQVDLARCIGITTQTMGRFIKDLNINTVKSGRSALVAFQDTRRIFNARGFNYPNRVFTTQMLKGGSGKTSATFNLAIRAHQYGFRVLIIDLDMQANMTATFGIEGMDHSPMVSYFRGQKSFQELIVPVIEGLDLIPSNLDNSSIDLEIFAKRLDFQTLLASPINEIRDRYDVIFFDCNPSLSALNVAAAIAADTVLVPVNPDTYSMDGLDKTVSEIARISEGRSKAPQVRAFYTLFDKRESTSRAFLVEYATQYKGLLLENSIPRSADVKTGTSSNRSVFELPKTASIKDDIDLLAREILGLSTHFESRLNG